MSEKKDDKIEELVKVFDGNLDLMLFYVTWIKNGLNATKAYQELHPNVTYESARQLGSQTLAKIDKHALMRAYGLDHDLYFRQLGEGIHAGKRDQFSGEVSPDHKTRRLYHEVLGKLLGVESDKPEVQINNMKLEIVQDAEET